MIMQYNESLEHWFDATCGLAALEAVMVSSDDFFILFEPNLPQAEQLGILFLINNFQLFITVAPPQGTRARNLTEAGY